ncbi:MAG: tRNA threonylcarbamoyladenosine biosynthesis protein TsaE [Planctomycetota bacterium]|jgi:tRNA threonylcarbamoyladenosine biosynthesis protein TsaE
MIRLIEDSLDAITLEIDSLEECRNLAVRLADTLRGRLPCVIALTGTLGAGKTQWTKFFAEELGANPLDVSSPTFVLIHPLATEPPIYHIDAYRITDSDEFLELGVEELFELPAITIIEWADRFPECMPRECLWIDLFSQDPTGTGRKLRLRNLRHYPSIAQSIRAM